MKRKILAVLLTVTMAVGMAACGRRAEEPQREETNISEREESKPEKTETPEASEEAKAPELKETSYSIMTAYPFSEDRAWVEYVDTDKSVTYTALIDTEGKVLYKTEKTVFMPTLMKDGVSAINIKKAKDETDEYHFIDNQGNDVGVLADEGAKVTILGSYGGKFLVMEEKSGFSSATLEIYIANKNGNKPAEPIATLDMNEGYFAVYDYSIHSLFGETFGSSKEASYTYNSQFISEFGHSIVLVQKDDGLNITDINMINENANINDDFNGFIITELDCQVVELYDTKNGMYISYEYHSEKYVYPFKEVLEGVYDAVRLYQEAGVFTSDGKVIEKDDEVINVYDIATGEPIREGIDLGGIISGIIPSADGQYLAVTLRGADNEEYITVLDKDLNTMYEPKPRKWMEGHVHVVNGYIVTEVRNNDGDLGGYAPDGSAISLNNDDVSGIGRDAELIVGNRWILAGSFINNSIINSETGYRSLDGKTIITQVVVTE